jgi:hypothetical protein
MRKGTKEGRTARESNLPSDWLVADVGVVYSLIM